MLQLKYQTPYLTDLNQNKMDPEKIIASDNYDELRTQFHALKAILRSKQAQIKVYEKRIKEFSFETVVRLEAELESQIQMNAILTEELDKSE